MNTNFIFAFAFGIGIVAGLRSLTAPAVVSWAAYLGWLNLSGSPLSLMGSGFAVGVFSLLAVGELVGDVLPTTPSRTTLVPFAARIVMGSLAGACLCAAAGLSLLVGAALGAIGAVVGTLGGYQARSRLVKGLGLKDIFVAIPEDLVAIGCAYFLVSIR